MFYLPEFKSIMPPDGLNENRLHTTLVTGGSAIVGQSIIPGCPIGNTKWSGSLLLSTLGVTEIQRNV